jgi:uncharacterized lipoprotein (TIGR02269 family)
MSVLPRPWGLLLCLVLTACAASEPAVHSSSSEAPDFVASWVEAGEGAEACEEGDTCVVLVCGEEACGLYRCEDTPWGSEEPVLLASRGGGSVPPGAPRRRWRIRSGTGGDALPVFIIPWRFHDRRQLLPSELARLKIHDPIKHHIFPQAPGLAAWFRRKGINIHQFTMVVERTVHDRIHRGSEGGPWNAAWREFIKSNTRATEAEIWEHAMKLILRFELAGPIVPYHWRVRSPPPPSQPR